MQYAKQIYPFAGFIASQAGMTINAIRNKTCKMQTICKINKYKDLNNSKNLIMGVLVLDVKLI